MTWVDSLQEKGGGGDFNIGFWMKSDLFSFLVQPIQCLHQTGLHNSATGEYFCTELIFVPMDMFFFSTCFAKEELPAAVSAVV